jgi:hypothetical protein
MRFLGLCFGAALLCATAARADDVQKDLKAAALPGRPDIKVVCWSVEGSSQITIYRDESVRQPPKVLYQSGVEGGYLPEIHFIEDIRPGGMPLILIQRNLGASIARLEIFGLKHGRITKISEIEGFQFDIERRNDKPVIFAHTMDDHVHMRTEYRWNGRGFLALALK